MHPILVRFTFETLFPLLLVLGGLCHLAGFLYARRLARRDSLTEKKQININSLKSLGNTFLLLAVTALVAFKALDLKELPLHTYGVMLALAFLVGLGIAQRWARYEGIAQKHVADIFIGILVAAIVGARLFFLVFEKGPKNLLDIIAVWEGGLVVYGGIICAVITTIVMVRRKKIPLGKVFDLFAPALAIGICLGRLGCFNAGCCYGNATDSPLGIVFPEKAQVYNSLSRNISSFSNASTSIREKQLMLELLAAGQLTNLPPGIPQPSREALLDEMARSVTRSNQLYPLIAAMPEQAVCDVAEGRLSQVHIHPSQLYESFSGLVLFVLSSFFYKRRRFAGEVLVLVAGGYAIARFFVETIRIDTAHTFLGSFSLAQTISLAGVPLIAGLWIYHRFIKKRPAAPAD